MSKKASSEAEGDVFELGDSENVLNLEFYLHRSILRWQDALDSAFRQGKDIEAGLVNRGLAGDMVEGIAKAKGFIYWNVQPVPEKKDKHRENVIKFNKEAEDFKKRYASFKKEIEKSDIPNGIKGVKLSDFKVFEVLKTISKNASKKGTVIV